ncbi:MAG: energy-coupling factor ABC transporter permease [Gammaproteobacteria bacterium]
MNPGLLPVNASLGWVCTALLTVVLLAALLRAPWSALVARQERHHMLFATLFALPLLWAMSFPLPNGWNLHLLGMTAVTLVFGWELAVVIGVLSGGALVLFGQWALAALPVSLVLVVIVPVGVTAAVLFLADRLRRTNLFVYMLGVGFGGGMLTLLATLLVGFRIAGPGLDHAVALLLVFPEGFLNGTIVTALTVFYPQIVRTYDDVKYLGPPRA